MDALVVNVMCTPHPNSANIEFLICSCLHLFFVTLHSTYYRFICLLSTALSSTSILWYPTNFQGAKFCAMAIAIYCCGNLDVGVMITKTFRTFWKQQKLRIIFFDNNILQKKLTFHDTLSQFLEKLDLNFNIFLLIVLS